MLLPFTTANLLFSWYRGKGITAFASICFLVLLSSVLVTSAATQEEKTGKGSISGRVTIQGKPAPGLEVGLFAEPYYNSGPSLANVNTDDEGLYQFANVPANHYFLKVKTNKYVNLNESRSQGTSVDWNLNGRSVSIADDAIIMDADLDLILGGAISGRVTDIEGNPVAGELVHLFVATGYVPQSLPWFYEEFKTNSNGEFRIYGIPHGHYFLGVGVDLARLAGAVTDRNDLSSAGGSVGARRYFEQMFYPGTPERGHAHAIEIFPAGEVSGISSILCHVNIIGTLPPDVRLMVDFDTGCGKGGWCGWMDIDANGDMLQQGLDPGDCNLAIGDGTRRFTPTQKVTVRQNQQAKVLFTVDASKIERRK